MPTITVKTSDIDDELFNGINSSRELRRVIKDIIDDTEALWHRIWIAAGPHPYETGDYEAHIKKKNLTLRQRLFVKGAIRHGVHLGSVYNDADNAWFIEFGTGPDNPNSNSPFGPDTPTPEFAIARKTAAQAKVNAKRRRGVR